MITYFYINLKKKNTIFLYSTIACIVVFFLTITGADYSKNTKCYKNKKNSYT